MGGAVFPSCCLTWGQTMVEVMKIMVTSFKRSHAHTAALSAPSPAAGHRRPTPPLETPGHPQASPGQAPMGSLLFSPGSSCTRFGCALQESLSPILWKFYNQIPLASSLAPWIKSYDQTRHHIERQRHYFANKGPSNQSYVFFSSHVWMWELDHKESWAPKNWCFWTVVLEKTLGSPLNSKEIQPVNPKGNQSWIFIGRTEAEAPILWPPVVKNWLTGKDCF